MEDEEFNKTLERILGVIYQVGENSNRESETNQIKYRNDQLSPSGKYQDNIDTAEEKKLYR